MGFSTLLDILGSTIIGALLLLILFRINDTAMQNAFSHSGELMVQQALVEAVSVIEYDFRKMGYCENWESIANPSNAIIFADTSSISFLTDLPSVGNTKGDGIVDTLHYYTGPTSELSETDNPNDRLLYRVINSATPVGSNIGITKFHLTYFDSFGKKEKLVYKKKDPREHSRIIKRDYDPNDVDDVALLHIKDSAKYVHDLRRESHR